MLYWWAMYISAKDYRAALRGEIILMTPLGRQAIDARLAALRAEKAQAEFDLGYAAQDYPDLRENAIYGDLAIKIQLDLPHQVDELREMLDKSRVVDGLPKKGLGLGSRFRARFGEFENYYWLVGPAETMLLKESDEQQAVSYLSPLGRVVWGAQAGQIVEFEVGGETRAIEVLEIL